MGKNEQLEGIDACVCSYGEVMVANNNILHVPKQPKERILEVPTAKTDSAHDDACDRCDDGLSLIIFIMHTPMKMSHCTHPTYSILKWHLRSGKTSTITTDCMYPWEY